MSESISHISSFSIVLPLILSILFFKNLNKPFRILGLLVVIGSLFEVAFNLFRGEFTMQLLNLYTIVELVFFSMFFNYCLVSKKFKLINFTLFVSFILIAIISTGFFYKFDSNNPATLLCESFIILILVFLNFYELIKKDVENYYSLGETWMIIGLFFYFAGNIFTFSYSSDYFSESQTFKFDVWLTHSLINIVLNICLAIAFYIEGRKTNFDQ